ncbi:MAG: septum formation initiator family protein [Propionibacteriaceae bacterium]|nr:septum formation initiator family protein [Propionibacteriaceae bacterium]
MGRQGNKQKSTGPGRGSPRTRTAARPGERTARDKVNARTVPVEIDDVPPPSGPPPSSTRGGRALGITWRLLVLGVVMAAVAITLAQSLRVYFAQRQEIAQYRVQILQTRDDIAELEDQLERWNDADFVRAEARSRLGWVMPGEVGYRVIGSDGEALGGDSAALSAPEEAATGDWWQRVWGSVVVADQLAPQPPPGASPTPDRVQEPSPTPSETP